MIHRQPIKSNKRGGIERLPQICPAEMCMHVSYPPQNSLPRVCAPSVPATTRSLLHYAPVNFFHQLLRGVTSINVEFRRLS